MLISPSSLIILLSYLYTIKTVDLFLSMNKILFIPGQRFSSMTMNHDLSTLQTNLFQIQIILNFTQTSENNQNNAIFDIIAAQKKYQQNLFECYLETQSEIMTIYSQYNPCREICDVGRVESVRNYSRLTNFSQVIGNNSYPTGNSVWIIDNTYYPCSNGSYMPYLYLQQQINLYIEQNKLFSSIVQIIFIVLLQIGIISFAYMVIAFKKYRKLKSQLEKLKSSQQAQEILDSFLEKSNQEEQNFNVEN